MKIYLKTCSLYEVNTANEYGLIDGAILISHECKESCIATDNDIKAISQRVPGPLFISIFGETADTLIERSLEAIRFGPNVVPKFNISPEALKACNIMVERDIPIAMDGINKVSQAIMAARSGAGYIFAQDTPAVDGSRYMEQTLDALPSVICFHGYEVQIVASEMSDLNEIENSMRRSIQAIGLNYKQLFKITEAQI